MPTNGRQAERKRPVRPAPTTPAVQTRSCWIKAESIGARSSEGIYERQIDANTVLTVEADYDVKDIQQTFSQIFENTNPNYKSYADLRHDGRLGTMPLKSYVGFFVNQMEQKGNYLPESCGWFRNERDIAPEHPWNDFQHRRPVP